MGRGGGLGKLRVVLQETGQGGVCINAYYTPGLVERRDVKGKIVVALPCVLIWISCCTQWFPPVKPGRTQKGRGGSAEPPLNRG